MVCLFDFVLIIAWFILLAILYAGPSELPKIVVCLPFIMVGITGIFCAIFSREKVDEGIIESMIEEDNREQNEQMEEYGPIDN